MHSGYRAARPKFCCKPHLLSPGLEHQDPVFVLLGAHQIDLFYVVSDLCQVLGFKLLETEFLLCAQVLLPESFGKFFHLIKLFFKIGEQVALAALVSLYYETAG